MSNLNLRRLGLAFAALACVCTVAAAAEPSASVRKTIAEKVPGAKPEDIHASPVPGLYEVSVGALIVYVSADGRYLFDGDLYDVESRDNLTEARRMAARANVIDKLDETQMIVFSPPDPKYTINVFTDIDCGYCRKLHSEIGKFNELGVRVRYLAYPRSGPGTPSWAKAEAVWCAKDRQDAITRAKAGQAPERPKDCKTTPVAKQYELGEEMGVRGTPAIITEDGDYLGGYVEPKRLVEYLDRSRADRLASKQ
jgi:thiol:disulfide interchange protein DsbC